MGDDPVDGTHLPRDGGDGGADLEEVRRPSGRGAVGGSVKGDHPVTAVQQRADKGGELMGPSAPAMHE
jgi:hypothetical protein